MTKSLDEDKYPMIVRAGTLAAFLAEVSPGATIRVMQTHRQHECFRTLFLHVQALTAGGAVAWLCEAHESCSGKMENRLARRIGGSPKG